VSKLDMPSHPDLLKRGQVPILCVQDCRKRLQGGKSSTLGEQNNPRQKAAVVVHSEELLSVDMPFRTVVEDPEVVLELPVSFPTVVEGKEGLRTEKGVRDVRVDQDLLLEGHHIAVTVQRFPFSNSDIFHQKTSSNAADSYRLIKASNGGRVHILQGVETGCGGTGVHHRAGDRHRSLGYLLEGGAVVIDATMQS